MNTLRDRGYPAFADRIGNDIEAFWLPDGSEGRTDESLNTREDGQDYLTSESAALRALLSLFEDIANKPAEQLSAGTRALLVRQEPVSEETQARLTAAKIEYNTAHLNQTEQLEGKERLTKSPAQAPAAAPVNFDDVTHSPGFRSVCWFGQTYSFTANQSKVVEILYENWLARAPDVDDETLLSAVDHEAPPARLATLFRGHEAWGTLIVPGGSRGTHRLCDPKRQEP